MTFESWEELVQYVRLEQDAGITEVKAKRTPRGVEFTCVEADGEQITATLTSPDARPLRAYEMLLLSDCVKTYINRSRA